MECLAPGSLSDYSFVSYSYRFISSFTFNQGGRFSLSLFYLHYSFKTQTREAAFTFLNPQCSTKSVDVPTQMHLRAPLSFLVPSSLTFKLLSSIKTVSVRWLRFLQTYDLLWRKVLNDGPQAPRRNKLQHFVTQKQVTNSKQLTHLR